MKRTPKTVDTTKIRYDPETERFFCEKCQHIFDYQFFYRFCPVCGRYVEKNEKRR